MSLAVRALVALCSCLLAYGQFNSGQFNTGQFNTGQFNSGQTGSNFNQMWGLGNNNPRSSWGNQANIGWWNTSNQRQEFRTCIGRNNMGDEVRVTFKIEEPDTVNSWFININQRDNIRFTAVVTSRSIEGQFNFVVTRYGRVEDSCQSRALGEVLPSNQWWNQNRIRGVIGRPVIILRGQRSTTSESLETLTMNEVNGRGLALCQSTRLSGSTCFDIIPLCCKVGRDHQDVTLGFAAGQVLGTGIPGSVAGGFGSTNGGITNPLGGGITGTGGGTFGSGSLPTGQAKETPINVATGTRGIGVLTFD